VRGISGKPLPPQVWEIVAASLILAWRIGTTPRTTLWRDWVVLMCGFWIFSVLAGKTKAWPVVLGLLMAFLFVLYGLGQVPTSMAFYGSLR